LAFLQVAAGMHSFYAQFLREITQELATQEMALESINGKQVASLLWQIFVDARYFFMAGVNPQGRLPGSRLDQVLRAVGRGLIATENNVPYGELMADTPNPHHQGSSLSNVKKAPSGGQEWPLTYPGTPSVLKEALKGARTRFPNITVLDIMGASATPLTYHQVKVGPGGACMDYLALGQCKDPKCSYNHAPDQMVTAAQATKAAPKLASAFKLYAAAH